MNYLLHFFCFYFYYYIIFFFSLLLQSSILSFNFICIAMCRFLYVFSITSLSFISFVNFIIRFICLLISTCLCLHRHRLCLLISFSCTPFAQFSLFHLYTYIYLFIPFSNILPCPINLN